MRRQLFDLYHAHVAPYVMRMPAGLRAALSGGFFAATRHPDFAFAHARHLVARGRADRAAALYGGPVEDPLFAAELRSEGACPDAPAVPGFVQAQIGYLGVRVSASIKTTAPVDLSLELDGAVLRRETLQPRAGRAAFRMILARPVLDQAPRNGLLQVRIAGRLLPTSQKGAGWRLTLPHGSGNLAMTLSTRGELTKKGQFRLTGDELATRQNGYLRLYSALKEVFETEFDRPLVILYGTLLGQVRAGDFIPGDDDFDVGYASPETRADRVRNEAVEIMSRLAELGFVIGFNGQGRPFRVRQADSPVWCHLDNRPVFAPRPGASEVWLHKHAALPLPLQDFQQAEPARMRDTEVLRPRSSERFLEAYYGPGWRVPDPGYTNTGRSLPTPARRALNRLCLRGSAQRALARAYPDHVIPVRYQALYPLSGYAARLGF